MSEIMTTSAQGVAFLERQEGVVLKAYRCPAGRWTIGAGLTAASGVVVPKAGMTITAEESRALTAKALEFRYEPAVREHMGRLVKQHEFDAGVSFHFNTGSIERASWVRFWRYGPIWDSVRKNLMSWTKGGGRVLPGLERRRQEEYELLRTGFYGIGTTAKSTSPKFAVFPLSMPIEEKEAAREALAALGYAAGDVRGAVAKEAALAFQRDYDLTVDGILGRASLSTLQRQIDARGKTAAAASVAGIGAAGTGSQQLTDALDQLPWVWPIVLAAGALWLAWLAIAYRDSLAAKIQRRAPGVAAYLRSI